MSSRPRRSTTTRNQTEPDPEADPDFLALPARKKRRIDKAFEKGVRSLNVKTRKRRKGESGRAVNVSEIEESEGGFLLEDGAGGFAVEGGAGGFISDDPDGGGFVLDDPDDAGGGFMLDDDAGGFVAEEPKRKEHPPAEQENTKLVPLYLLPTLLTSLGLPSDEDVLQVFRASASGWSEQSRGEEGEESGGVELKDFRAVCAALMGPEEEGAEGQEEGGDMESDDGAEEDLFQPSDAGSDLSSESGSLYGGPSTRSAIPTVLKTTPAKGKGTLEGRARLSAGQRAMAKDIWEMLKPPDKQGRGADILGRDEVKTWVRTLGEMWSDDEITDMVTLFSSQHEGRGLTFEDFGKVMLRAGLV